ncbi:glycosyl hydrolase 108 family protein [Ciceribacter sp. L1K22]|uniref:glycoside hydrolase family 108 protein n=1 Tax=Ciceribacter sp. L1K22 TaxID=2820275 RepID=UPI001ABE4AB3|nr:glycosyl hydrolase 108 family protein [Ciceribacter sp. L1K22]MBO3760340.1 secretion activator protein [Ciceribacter sp. L1K22]
MSDRFDVCHPITAKWEGGWSNHKADPGGATMYGVTQAKFTEMLKKWGQPNRSVRTITMAEALRIYREEFWVKCGAPNLFPGVDLAVYDASVNSGVSRGRKWLTASVGSNDHSVTVKKICRTRLSFMQGLKIWKSFGNGWGRRVADIEVKGVAMALKAMGSSDAVIGKVAKIEAVEATKSAAANDKAAKTTATGSAGAATAPAVDQGTNVDLAALWVLGIIAVGLLVAFLVFHARKKAAKARAEAYEGLAA